MTEKGNRHTLNLDTSVPYWVIQKLPQMYTSNHATFPIRIRKITVQICGNIWITQYNHIEGPFII